MELQNNTNAKYRTMKKTKNCKEPRPMNHFRVLVLTIVLAFSTSITLVAQVDQVTEAKIQQRDLQLLSEINDRLGKLDKSDPAYKTKLELAEKLNREQKLKVDAQNVADRLAAKKANPNLYPNLRQTAQRNDQGVQYGQLPADADRKQVEYAEQKVKEAKSINDSLKLQLEQNRLIQRRLQNSQSYSEGVIESSLDMIFTTDIKGKITKFNSAAKKELLLEKEDFLKEPFEILLKNKERGEKILEELNQKNAFSGEVEMQRKDGTSFPAFLSISYLFNLDGAFLGIMGVSRDISDIISKEQEIKEQASKLTAIIESSSHFFCTINRNYRITSLNESFVADSKQKEDCEIELFDEFFKLFEKRNKEEYKELKRFWIEKIDVAFKGKSIQFFRRV